MKGSCLATGLPYLNDSGAINESLSDIMGNLIETYITETDDTEWLIGEGGRKHLAGYAPEEIPVYPAGRRLPGYAVSARGGWDGISLLDSGR